MEYLFPFPKMGTSFLEILHDPLTRKLLGFDAVHAEKISFTSGVSSRLTFLLNDATKHLSFLKIGYTALEAFLQANCTGPPLDFNPEDSIFPDIYRDDQLPVLKQELLRSLSVDGTTAYSLTPHIELFWLAKLVLSSSVLAEAGFNGRRARFRVTVWHQKLLNEKSNSLQTLIYQDADVLEQQLSSRLAFGGAAAEEHFVEFLVERAQIRIFYGDDHKAREDLARAAKTRQFYFALTGALGKRTKYQVDDISQLVVLAKSRDFEPEPYSSRKSSRVEGIDSRKGSRSEIRPLSRTPTTSIEPPRSPSQLAYRPHTPTSPRADPPISPLSAAPRKPESIPLNDDTLLEHIAFKDTPSFEPNLTHVSDESSLPSRLSDIDPANQPLLFPMDSIILLATASSIQNTSPADGLTREETLPYATRVLDGGSSNWQVYTQALLVRSRIEGYKSRTTERGLLQLQALVDQVVAETTVSPSAPPKATDNTATTTSTTPSQPTSAPTTFLPPPRHPSEAATVAERLKYIYQLSPPLRWELEAELAARWTSLGGLKTALEIYRRLQMHAEVALCLAATGAEVEALWVLRGLLFVDAKEKGKENGLVMEKEKEKEKEKVEEGVGALKPKSQLPPDAPRLLCILGDISLSQSPPTATNPSTSQAKQHYTLSYSVSNSTYPRAQRSLARLYTKLRDFSSAASAYKLALRNAQLDHATWFALGCVQLELQEWESAVETFRRVVAIDADDAEGWSNLAVVLLRLPVPAPVPVLGSVPSSHVPDESEDQETLGEVDEEVLLTDSDSPTNQTPPSTTTPFPKTPDPHGNKRSALLALRRAATLKRDDARIWDNYLTVATSIPPSAGTPWPEILQAFTRLVELRGQKEGEGAVDLKVLGTLVDYVIQTFPQPRDPSSANGGTEEENATGQEEGTFSVPEQAALAAMPYLPRALLTLVTTHITPLATSPELYKILARVALWRNRPSAALSYHEKAWRAATSAPDTYGRAEKWERVVAETETLVRAYQDLGVLEKETGRMSELIPGPDGEAEQNVGDSGNGSAVQQKQRGKEDGATEKVLVEKNWRFKSRSAIRSVIGRGREAGFEDSKAMETLRELLESVK